MSRVILMLFLTISVTLSAQVDILSVDFETGIPSSFSIVDADGLTPDPSVSEYINAWIAVADQDDPTDTVAATTSYFTPPGTADRWLISPALQLGSFGNFISWKAKSQDASYPDDYLVLLSNTDNSIASFSDTLGYIIEENFEWTERSVDLSSLGLNDQTIYIAFRLITEDGFKLYIDDIHAWKEDASGLVNLNVNNVRCFPNPAGDKVTITFKGQFEHCEVWDNMGKQMLVSFSNEFSVAHLPPGVFQVKVFHDGNTSTLRLVKI